MTVGNLSALYQDNMKRLLAYSSIAHAGYILVGLTAGDVVRGAGGAVLPPGVRLHEHRGVRGDHPGRAEREDDGYAIGNLGGMGFRRPVLAGLLSLFLVSLAGIPPTAGFVGKFYLFGAAVKSGHILLAVIAVLNSAVSLYYYLRPVVQMYMMPETAAAAGGEAVASRSPRAAFSLALCVFRGGDPPARRDAAVRARLRGVVGDGAAHVGRSGRCPKASSSPSGTPCSPSLVSSAALFLAPPSLAPARKTARSEDIPLLAWETAGP